MQVVLFFHLRSIALLRVVQFCPVLFSAFSQNYKFHSCAVLPPNASIVDLFQNSSTGTFRKFTICNNKASSRAGSGSAGAERREKCFKIFEYVSVFDKVMRKI